MNDRPSWEAGLGVLRERQTQLPAAILGALSAPLSLDEAARAIASSRAVLTTGVGSSLAHARYLSWLLRTQTGTPSWDVPTGSYLSPPGPEAKEQTLVVFSQGLSPNARPPLAHVARYRSVILVTAADADSPDRAAAAHAAANAGAIVVRMPCAPEYEVLLRITGPAVGYAVALRLANAVQGGIELPLKSIANALPEAASRASAALAGVDPRVLADPITFVATGGYAVLAHNLAAKVLEGMLLPWPAAVDAFEFAHGTIQEASNKSRTFIALGRGAAHEDRLFARVRQLMEPQHRWLELTARLAEPHGVFEHELMVNELVLASIAARRVDQREWPGKGRDGPLYSLASTEDLRGDAGSSPREGPMNRVTTSRRLEDLTWPEIEARVAKGSRTAVIPLGATEQHGPHMPLAVDTWVADALGARFCARVPEALQALTIGIGCSVEHMGLAGTLSIAPTTLIALIGDAVASLVQHGFDHVVIFSAHGGNDASLAAAATTLADRARPAKVTVVHGVDAIGRLSQEASADAGAHPRASGHHAGEFETSIIAALRPDSVRWNELRTGSEASAERGERYLQAWTTFIVDAYLANKQVKAVVT